MSANPLQSYFRQPKIYVNLPSKGKFYPLNAIEETETGEFPIFAMTASDEISFKTPDALFNGQATVDVVQSCVPNIKNAWLMPTLDLDAILIAIRIATYGEMMDINTKIPGTDEERTYQLDLRQTLDSIVFNNFEEQVTIDDLVINIKPLTYKEFTQSALKTFEEQRIFSIVNNEDLTEEEKLSKFGKSFKKLTQLTIGMVSKSIVSIQTDNDLVQDPAHIDEFIKNADKKFYNKIVEHIENQKEKFTIKPLEIECDQELIEKGAPESFTLPITFDQANFFGQGS